MNKADDKYEFTGKEIKRDDVTLKEIRALKDYWAVGVPEGTVGGYIQSEDNLTQEGRCWVDKGCMIYGNAKVSGNAVIEEKSIIHGDAIISGNARVSGESIIYGNAIISGNARVGWESDISGKVCIDGEASVEFSTLSGDEHFSEDQHDYINRRLDE